MKKRHLPVRIDDELLRKFHYVCEYVGRSANNQLLYYIRKLVASFEKEHGKIELPPEENPE